MKTKVLMPLLLFLMIPNLFSQKINKTENSIKSTIDQVHYEITFFSPTIVHILKSPDEKGLEKTSFSVTKEPENIKINIKESEERILLSSSELKVILDKTTGKTTFLTLKDKLLLSEKENGSLFTPIKDVDEETYLVQQSFKLDNDEAIYGLGQFQDGKMIQRNQKLYLLQDILITAIPFFQTDKGYGIFWDNTSPTYFSDNAQETSFESTVGNCVDYYFMYGVNADGVISEMRDLTGQAPMFPYWTFGYWQSKERYKNQDETVGVLKKYRELGIPIDGIIQDWQYWGDNYHWNAMEFLNPEFPNPQKMVDEVHELNGQIIFSIWSSFGPKTAPYKELEQNGMLFDFDTWPLSGKDGWPPDMNYPSGVRVYDAYNPKARDIYWKYLNKGIFSLGVDGWWMDSTEPDHFNRKDSDYNQKTHLGSFRKNRNLYPLLTVGNVYTNQRKESSEKRVFILTRSAFAGQQRYGANSWSGDVTADWPALKNQISAGLNFSLCGIPYWNSDIGGFFLNKFPGNVNNPAYKELYVRWMQFGAFCPMMRSHGTDAPREIYQFGDKGLWAYNVIEKYINLRYSLLPYIYSTSWDVTVNSSSMMRALMMDFVEDKNALDINDEYMFGKSILVCPVTEPMYTKNDGENLPADFSEIKTREIYLPAGTQWFDFWTGEMIEGGQNIERETPIDILPLYVKAGSIIPFGPKVQYANEKIGPLTIRIYPGADASFTFYDDERDNYNYEDGAYVTFEMKWNENSQTFTIEDQQGKYQGMPDSRNISIVKVSKDSGTGIPLINEVKKEINYTGKKVEIKL